MIGELVSCGISETRNTKRDWIHVLSSRRADHGEVKWSQKGRVAPEEVGRLRACAKIGSYE